LFALLLCYAIFVNGINANVDESCLWHHTCFWIVVQFCSGVSALSLLVVQYLALFDVTIPQHYSAFGLGVFAPVDASKCSLYLFTAALFVLYTSASHHRLVQSFLHSSENLAEETKGSYGTFNGEEEIENETWTSTVLGSHQLCALIMMFWSLWLQSSITAFFLLTSFLAFIFEGRLFAVLGPFTLFYSLVYVMMQSIYQIPSVAQSAPMDVTWMTFIGFRVYEYPAVMITSQYALACWVALYVHHASKQVGAKQGQLADLATLGDGAASHADSGLSTHTQRSIVSGWTKCKLLFGFIFSNAFLVTCAAGYMYAISQLSILNTGYLILSLFFFCFPSYAPWGWVVYVVYSQLVIVILYAWQFVPAEYITKLTEEAGLHLYQVPWRNAATQGIWTTDVVLQAETSWEHVLAVPVFILLFALIQHTIFKQVQDGLRDEAIVQGLKAPRLLEEAIESEMPTLFYVVNFCHHMLEEFGGILAFASMLFHVTVQEPNVINLGYIIFISLLCFSFTPAGHGPRSLFRLVWSAAAFYTAFVLLLQYSMEFPNWHADGLEKKMWKLTGFTNNTSRVLMFLPTTLTLLLSLYYVKILGKESTNNSRVQPKTDEMSFSQMVTNLLKRFAILHMGKLFVITLVMAALLHPNSFGFGLICYTIMDLFMLSRGGLSRWPVMALSFLYLLAEYMYVISVISHGNSYSPLRASAQDPEVKQWAAWAGFGQWSNTTVGVQPCLWTGIFGSLANSAVKYWALELPEEGKRLDEDSPEPCLLFLRQPDSRGEPFQKLREHLNDAFSKHGSLMTLTMMVVAACARTNMISMFYLLIASLSLVVSQETLSKSVTLWTAVFCILSAYLLFQYVLLWDPQGTSRKAEMYEASLLSLGPWVIPHEYKQWLCLEVNDKWYMLADFCAMLFAALQARSSWLPDVGPSPLEFDENDMETGDILDRMLVGAIRIFICNYSPTFVTVSVAIVGGAEVTMVNFVYLIIALVFLSYGTTLMRTKNLWWQFLRFYNILVLILGSVAHSPFWKKDKNLLSVKTNSGLWSDLGLQVVIYFLLALQSDIFNWEQYEKALGYLIILKQQGKHREAERCIRERQNRAKRVVEWLQERLYRQETIQALHQESTQGELAPKETPPIAQEDLPRRNSQQESACEGKVEHPAQIREATCTMRGGISTMYSWSQQILVLDENKLVVYRDDGTGTKPDDDAVFTYSLRDVESVGPSSRGPNVWKLNMKQDKDKALFTMASEVESKDWITDVQLYVDVRQGKATLPSQKDKQVIPVAGEESWWGYCVQYVTLVLPDFVAQICETLETHDEYYNPDTKGGRINDTQETQLKSRPNATLALRLFLALQGAVLSYSGALVYALLVLNHAITGGIVTMVLPILSFLWAVPMKGRAPQWWWHLIILYTLCLVSIQYIIDLPAFCDDDTMYGIAGHCTGLTDASMRYLTAPYIVGIRSGSRFLSVAWVDIAILVAAGVHIMRLQYTGRWEDLTGELHSSNESEDIMNELHVELPPGVTEEDYNSADEGICSTDYYAYVFFADSAVLLWCMFFYSHMTNSGQSFGDAIRTNNLDWAFVLVLVLQFLTLVIDRVMYLTKANQSKLYLHLFQVVGLHTVLLLVFQMQSGNQSLCNFYLLKCCYFAFSAVQIRDQYPIYTQGQYLIRTEKGKEPSTTQYYLFLLYRACPFLFELRILLDWACSRTSLDFYQWFKFEDIHGQLFTTKCLIQQRKLKVGNHSNSGGQAQSWGSKVGVGFGMFAALCVLLFLPLVLFSNGSVLMVPNPVRSASLRVSLNDGFRSYRLYYVESGMGRMIEQQDLQILNRQKVLQPYFEKTGTQVVRFPSISDTVFDAPPPLMLEVIESLNNPNSTMSIQVETVMERDLPMNNREPRFESATELTLANKEKMLNVINSVMSSNVAIQSSFVVENVVPDVVYLPSATPPSELGEANHNIFFTFHRAQTSGMWDQWWEIQYQQTGEALQPVEVFAVSGQVIGSYMGVGSTISKLGVVGLYVSVVFVIGRLLRGYVANLQTRVMYEDMEDVSVPMYWCENIILARQEAGTALDNKNSKFQSNALQIEDHLYWELIRLYRQPEKLFRWTTRAGVSPESSLLRSYKEEMLATR